MEDRTSFGTVTYDLEPCEATPSGLAGSIVPPGQSVRKMDFS
jgi:hypothetical protein